MSVQSHPPVRARLLMAPGMFPVVGKVANRDAAQRPAVPAGGAARRQSPPLRMRNVTACRFATGLHG
ncbi:hypothetical protein [Massilia sp. 9096]|uniref:hypothetical protein n=1 Tax=Massilia sp. 9096 TaxID=1500894 RepID=UPI0012E01127|nr:hypothetical protein [Massilia sp. 9096]